MRKKKLSWMIIWIPMVFMFFGFPAFGNAPETVRLGDLLEAAYRENPTIQAEKAVWKSTVERFRVAGGYPDPRVMMTWFPEPIETRLGPQDWNLTLTQMVPFPGKLGKKEQIAALGAQLARLKLEKTVRDVSFAVIESVAELSYIRTSKQVSLENARLIEHILKVGETNYANERGLLSDIVKARAQAAQIRYDILLQDELEKKEIARLNGLLNRSVEHPVGVIEPIRVVPIAYTLQKILELAERNREEIRIAGVKKQQARLGVELNKYRNIPDFRVGLFYASIGDPDVPKPPDEAGRDAVGIQFGMNLPVSFGKNAGAIAGARALEEKAKADEISIIQDTRVRITDLYYRLRNAERLVALYRNELIPQAERSLELSETWSDQGAAPFTDYLEIQSVQHNFKLALARAEADYIKFLAKLERFTGVSLTSTTETENTESVTRSGKEEK